MKKKVTSYHGLRYLLLVLLFLMVFPFQSAEAAEPVKVSNGICPNKSWGTDTPLYGLVSSGRISAPVRFELSNGHKDMKITLVTVSSFAFIGDASAALGGGAKNVRDALLQAVAGITSPDTIPELVPNVYSVYFLDYNGNRVWSEHNAIPNGRGREFFVGSNVKYICVYSWYNFTSPGSYIKGRIPGSVSYSNAYEI